jgi:hypothetical protein
MPMKLAAVIKSIANPAFQRGFSKKELVRLAGSAYTLACYHRMFQYKE